jgi:hypothetical protein
MRKIIALFVLLVGFAALVGCGQTPTPAVDETLAMQEIDNALNQVQIAGTVEKDVERLILPNNKQSVYFIWRSDDESIITNSGVVTHDLMFDHSVTLTVTAKYKSYEKTRTYAVLVKNTDADTLAAGMLDKIILPPSTSENLTLPEKVSYLDQEFTLTWESSDVSLLTAAGEFVAATKNEVVLSTKMTVNGKEYKKDFPIEVYPRTRYVVSSISDFEAINNNLDGLYILNNDIDFAGVSTTAIGSMQNPFTGIFRGNGHTLNNVNLTISDEATGLFAVNKGIIDKLRLKALTVTGTVTTQSYVGSLAGLNYGLIDQCFADGTLNVTDSKEDVVAVGGLIGQINDGVVSNSVSSVVTTVNLTHATNNNVLLGGFTGHVTGGVVKQSFFEDRANARNNSTGTSVGITGAGDNTISSGLFAGKISGGQLTGVFALGSLVVTGFSANGTNVQKTDNLAGTYASLSTIERCFVLDTSRIIGRSTTTTCNQMSSSSMVTEDWYHTMGFTDDLWDFNPIHQMSLGVAALKIFI